MIKKKNQRSLLKKLEKAEKYPPRVKTKAAIDLPLVSKQTLKLLILFAVLIVIVTSAVLIVHAQLKLSTDRGVFNTLRNAIADQGNLIKKSVPDLADWKQESQCGYSYSTEVSSSGWRCRSGLSGTLSIQSLDELNTIVAEFKTPKQFVLNSINLTKLTDSGYATSEHVIYGALAKNELTNIDCELGFRNENNTLISVGFDCTGTALASWYPNMESNTTLPGINAYKK